MLLYERDDNRKYPTLYHQFSCKHVVIRDHREWKECPVRCKRSYKEDFFLIKQTCRKCGAEFFVRYGLKDGDVKHGAGGHHPKTVDLSYLC
jgi:hypothetical protein